MVLKSLIRIYLKGWKKKEKKKVLQMNLQSKNKCSITANVKYNRRWGLKVLNPDLPRK